MNKVFYQKKALSSMVLVLLLAFFFLIAPSVTVNAYAPVYLPVYHVKDGEALAVRYNEEEIVRDDHMKNIVDVIALSDYGLNATTLINAGKQTLVIYVYFIVREINDGYQRFYVYNGSGSSASQLANFVEFDYGGNTTLRTEQEQGFYMEINLSDVINNKVYLRYGARGMFQNNWFTRNVFAEVYTSYYQRNYSSIQKLNP